MSKLTTYTFERTRTIVERASVVLEGEPTDEEVLNFARDPHRIWRRYKPTTRFTVGEATIVARAERDDNGYL